MKPKRKLHSLIVFLALPLVLALLVTRFLTVISISTEGLLTAVAFGEDKLTAILNAQLTSSERASGVVYAFIDPVPAGTKLQFPRITIEVPWEALLAFVDREPLANWGHSCRYVLVNPATGKVRSTEARFPPFRPEDLHLWRVVFQATGVPDSALAVPKQ
jgi:hypothetical protein